MNLRYLLLLLLGNVFASAANTRLYTSTNTDIVSTTKNSLLTMIISSFSSLPRVEEAFYAEYQNYESSHPVAASIARVLAEIRRTSGQAVELWKHFDRSFLDKVSDDKYSIDDLFQLLCGSFPPSIKSLFDLKVKASFIKDKFEVPVPRLLLRLKQSTQADGRGIMDDYNIITSGATRETEFSQEIVEHSKVIVFHLGRNMTIDRNFFFNTRLVLINPNITVNGQEYRLKVSLRLEGRLLTKKAAINEFKTEFLDDNSLLLFYTLKEEDEAVEIHVPEALTTTKKRPLEPDTNNDTGTGSDDGFDEAIRKFPKNQPNLRKVLENRRSEMSPETFEFLNKFSRYSTYTLGTETYAFLPGPNGVPYGAVELVLSVMASNKKLVVKLFESVGREVSDSLNFKMAVIIFKMLMGCKNISLDEFAGALAQAAEIDPKLLEWTTNVPKVSSQVMAVINSLDAQLIHAPGVKLIEYLDLECDDPIETRKTATHEGIRPSSLLPPRNAEIKGLWCDTCDPGTARRVRRIYSSPLSELIPIQIDRFVFDPIAIQAIFENLPVKLYGNEYKGCGTIGIDMIADRRRIAALSYNDFTGKIIYFTPGSPSREFIPSKEFIQFFTERYSLFSFYRKKVESTKSSMYIGQVPTRVSATTFSHSVQQCGFKHRFQVQSDDTNRNDSNK